MNFLFNNTAPEEIFTLNNKNDQHFNSYGPDKNYTTAAVMKPSLNPSTPKI